MATESTFGSILFARDLHVWTEDVQPCPLDICKGDTHGMKCAVCGIRRHGPFAEQGNYHYFMYDQRDGQTSEFIPPCTAPLPEDVTIDEMEVCAVWDHPIDPATGKCVHGCGRGTKKIRFCRSLKPQW